MVLPYYTRISLLLSQTGAERENDVRRGMCAIVNCFYINVRVDARIWRINEKAVPDLSLLIAASARAFARFRYVEGAEKRRLGN